MTDRVSAVLTLLSMDGDWRDPNPERSKVTAIQHALQCATRARRHDPADVEMVCAALLHDAARPLSDVHHGEVVAWLLKDRVRWAVFDALYRHGEFQSAMLHRRPLPLGPPEALHLAAWDYASFDPNFRTDRLDTFLPVLHRLLD
jgi:predicted HD phosphohydrolase